MSASGLICTDGQACVLPNICEEKKACQRAVGNALLNDSSGAGALARLVAMTNLENMEQWAVGEIVRGTLPSDRWAAVSSLCTTLMFNAAMTVKESDRETAAKDLKNALLDMFDKEMKKLRGGAVSRLPPRLRVITNGGDKGK